MGKEVSSVAVRQRFKNVPIGKGKYGGARGLAGYQEALGRLIAMITHLGKREGERLGRAKRSTEKNAGVGLSASGEKEPRGEETEGGQQEGGDEI